MARQVRISDDVAAELERRLPGSLSSAADSLLRWALAEVDIPGEHVDRPVDHYPPAPAGKARTSTRSALAAGFGTLSRNVR